MGFGGTERAIIFGLGAKSSVKQLMYALETVNMKYGLKSKAGAMICSVEVD